MLLLVLTFCQMTPLPAKRHDHRMLAATSPRAPRARRRRKGTAEFARLFR